MTKTGFQGMRPPLQSYFQEKIDIIQDSVLSLFPEDNHDDNWFKFFLNDKHFSCEHDVTSAAMYKPMRQYLKAKGKLFRPMLGWMILEGYNKDPQQFKPILLISELIHCSSLILDDIVDRSLLRRSEPCSHIIHGITLAGNGSIAATFYAFNLINHSSMPLTESAKLKLYNALFWEHYGCSLGTALDLGWSKSQLTEIDHEQYIQHIVYRSCAYTYRVALRVAAIAAGVSPQDQEALFNYGTYTGIAFQFIDDILNLKPQTSSWGKTVGEDITEGKRSPLILHTLKAANSKDKKRLLKILDSKTRDESEIQEAISILDKHDAFSKIQTDANQYIELASAEVEKLSIETTYKTLLKDFAVYVIERKI